ncbi:MAG: hypothetical protein IIU67_03490, partial [Lachnospiraceae bacterium]|nr:hypothetical protein [Lachnospiraceae bacterium]
MRIEDFAQLKQELKHEIMQGFSYQHQMTDEEAFPNSNVPRSVLVTVTVIPRCVPPLNSFSKLNVTNVSDV